MDVQHALRERAEQSRLDDPHEAREDHRVDAAVFQHGNAALLGLAVKLGLERRTIEPFARDAVPPGTADDFCVSNIGKDQPHFGVQRAGLDRIQHRLHV